MKIFIILTLAFSPVLGFANSALEKKVEQLEKRIQMLEAKLGSKTSSGLKVKDMGNTRVQTGNSGSIRSLSSSGQARPQISKEQQEEMMKQLQLFKESQQRNQKILDEIMNEDM